MFAAATRPWYLPTWVNIAMPVTSPIAQTSAGSAEPLVDLDPVLPIFDPELLEAETLDVRPPAGGDEQPLGLDRPAASRWSPDARLDPSMLRAEAELDALGLELLPQEVRRHPGPRGQ